MQIAHRQLMQQIFIGKLTGNFGTVLVSVCGLHTHLSRLPVCSQKRPCLALPDTSVQLRPLLMSSILACRAKTTCKWPSMQKQYNMHVTAVTCMLASVTSMLTSVTCMLTRTCVPGQLCCLAHYMTVFGLRSGPCTSRPLPPQLLRTVAVKTRMCLSK